MILLSTLALAATVEGSWFAELTIATRVPIPVIGDVRGASRSELRVDIHREADGSLRWAQRLCTSEVLDRGALVRTVLPDSFVRAVPPREVDILATEQGFTVDLGEEAVGFALPGPVPRSPSDPRVTDWDGDGNPGARVIVKVGKIGESTLDVAQLGHSVLSLTLHDNDELRGSVDVRRLEQRILQASNPLFAVQISPQPEPARSGFVARRVAPGSGCPAKAPL